MPTITTKTIGSTGDYTTLASWEAACPANLVSSDEIWRGEVLNEEFSSATTLLTISGQTTDATRYVELTTAAGASFADNANKLTNALRYNASNGAGIKCTGDYVNAIVCSTNYTKISKLQFTTTRTQNYGYSWGGNYGSMTGCITDGKSVSSFGGQWTLTNNLFSVDRTSVSAVSATTVSYLTGSMFNCTMIRPTNNASGGNAVTLSYNSFVFKNCAAFNFSAWSNALGSCSGNNNATDLSSVGFGSSNQTSLTISNQLEQPNSSSGLDCRIKTGASLIANGADLSGSGVTTDIVGTTRTAPYDISAWQVQVSGQPPNCSVWFI